jgi:hypothetical protein
MMGLLGLFGLFWANDPVASISQIDGLSAIHGHRLKRFAQPHADMAQPAKGKTMRHNVVMLVELQGLTRP